MNSTNRKQIVTTAFLVHAVELTLKTAQYDFILELECLNEPLSSNITSTANVTMGCPEARVTCIHHYILHGVCNKVWVK